LIGHPVENMRVVLTDGASHAVDSSEMAFKLAALSAFRQVYEKAKPKILEPVMRVEITVPSEFQGTVIGNVNRRKGTILDSNAEGDDVVVQCIVPLKNMFGYSTELRSMTQGKGEFTMEYSSHQPVTQDVQAELTAEYGKTRKQAE
jgi:elongation factor G